MRLLHLFLILFLCFCKNTNTPRAVLGSINLQTWNFEHNGSIALAGDWEFYWEKFLYPEDFQKTADQISPYYTKIPAVWNNLNYNGEKLPGHGYATYRVKVHLGNADNKRYALQIPDQAHAYRLFINGVFILESGIVGKSYETMQPDLRQVFHTFTINKPELDIIFHVSNFHHRAGGLRFEILLGLEEQLLYERNRQFIIDAFLYGGFFIIAVYHLAIYVFRRKNNSPLYFAFFCLSILFYSLISGQRLFHFILPNFFDWELSFKIEFTCINLILISIFEFFTSLYPPKKKPIIYIYTAALSLFILFIFFTKPVVFTEYFYLLQLASIFSGLFIIYHLVHASIQKKEGSFIFLLAILILFICAMIDIISINMNLSLPRFLKFGIMAMVIMQAILLAKIFTQDFLRSEILSNSLKETNHAYSKFVPTEFLKLLDKTSIIDIHLGDHTQKEMTILFSDIRSFTSLSEKMTPNENFQFLNSYLNRIAPIIKSNHGFIDKYIGDAIMGLFPENADDAVLASIAMQKEIEEYNTIRRKYEKTPLKVGIGLHTGSLILGTIGHDERMEGTVISDAVNLASRLEGLTKHYGSNILISEKTFNSLEDPGRYNYRLLDNVLVKGKEESIFVIEILDGFPEDLLEKFMITKKDFEIGSLLYKQKAFGASIDFFQKVLAVNREDTATAFYLKRAEYYDIHGAPPDWEGGEVFLDK